MSFEMLQDDVQRLSESDFQGFLLWLLNTERPRRASLPAVQAGQAALVQQLRDSGTIPALVVPDAPEAVEDFPAWESTINASHTYLPGDMVAVEGRVWKSTYSGCNKETPGSWVAGDTWVDVTDEVLAPVAVHPIDDEEEDEEGEE